MEKCKNNFKDSSDPGAVLYGNFKQYYQFNPVPERLELLPKDIFSKCNQFYALDVGCNSGDLTIALQQKIQQYACEHASILGIDLDGDLIKLAEDKLKDCDKKITFQQANIMLEEGRSCIADYLHNNAIAQFDVSFCFSVTMWIHLNHGDEGLKEFLQYLCSVSKLLVIEPQEWKSYNAANRRLRRNNVQEFPKLGELKMRYNVAEEIERYLIEDCKASLVQKSAKTHWGRTVLILKCS